MLILFTLGCNFRVWSTILKQVKNPQPLSEITIKIAEACKEAKMRYFPILQFLWGGRGGGGSKSSIMIATLKRIERNRKPPIPLKTRIRHVKAKACHLFGGRWGWGGGELMTSFCLFCQKTALHKVENGKGHSTWGTLIRHGISPLSGQTMQADSRLQNSQCFPRNRFFKIFPWSTQA